MVNGGQDNSNLVLKGWGGPDLVFAPKTSLGRRVLLRSTACFATAASVWVSTAVIGLSLLVGSRPKGMGHHGSVPFIPQIG